MLEKKRILICPLDWGLGHATRCIPIIQLLLQKRGDVLLAGSGRSLALVRKEFPELEVIELPGYDIRYSKGSMALKILLSVPKILKGIKREHRALEKIILDKRINLVISDNRYGLWSKHATTVFITHQLFIKTFVGQRFLNHTNLGYIKRFTECWIPDVEGSKNLSGDLSHQYPLPPATFFIGGLSRFHFTATADTASRLSKKTYEVMFIISGPEPQRSIFESLIFKQAVTISSPVLIVRGITEGPETKETSHHVDIVSHMTTIEMKAAIQSAAIIVSRSGYSTLMDLAALKKKAIFIPTPGQTEQEYLAKRCMRKNIAYMEQQETFNLKRALVESEKYTGFEEFPETDLEKRVELMLGRI